MAIASNDSLRERPRVSFVAIESVPTYGESDPGGHGTDAIAGDANVFKVSQSVLGQALPGWSLLPISYVFFMLRPSFSFLLSFLIFKLQYHRFFSFSFVDYHQISTRLINPLLVLVFLSSCFRF